jgi:hypothetical protein
VPIVTQAKLKKVEVLLEGDGPSEDGWWAMYCPYHGDSTRSAGLSTDDGRFVCHACGERKTIDEIIADRDKWDIRVPGLKVNGTKVTEEINEAMIDGWHSGLLSNSKRLNALIARRGLNLKTITKYELGWDTSQSAYTIPIRGMDGEILNVRFYQIDVPDERRKIWSVNGMGTPVLWPMDQLDYVNIVVCEGEMDAMLTIQNGIPAITRTGAADVWSPAWSKRFAGKIVYVCHDADTKGKQANRKISLSLKRHALRTIVLELPYETTANHGKDLTDYWMEGRSRQDFILMAKEASEKAQAEDGTDDTSQQIFDVNVMRSFDASLVGKPLKMKVTIVGKRTPSYVIPQKIHFECDQGAAPSKCANCTLNDFEGNMDFEINPDDPVILRLIKVAEDDMNKVLQRHAGIAKCPRFTGIVEEHRTVEEAYVRASIEDGPGHTEQDFTHRRIVSAVSHDLEANQSVVLTGTIRPHPKNQENEFQAWDVSKPATGLDKFQVTPEVLDQMREFQAEDPMTKLAEIADDLAVNHTKIINRKDLHILTDLVFHSVIELPFTDSTDSKGWLDCLVLGDTRTGKSAIARSIVDLYHAGEMISCEAATFAGVVGGLDHMSDGSWIVKWGSVPVFDRRAVVLDEVSGLKQGEINQMSDMRSSGIAKLTKIKSEQAMARTRLLWLGNSRDGKFLNSNTYAVDAVKRLIGNSEDIARFDIAMCVFTDEVDVGEINKFRTRGKTSRFTVDGYRGVLQWAWTRKGKDIKWERGVEQLVFDQAKKMGGEYTEDPPLVQGANMRMKIARTAAAIAARTFSTLDGKRLIIKAAHVLAAVDFIDSLYAKPGFGYKTLSQQALRNLATMQANMEEIKTFIHSFDNLVEMIKMNPEISFMQLKTFLGTDELVRKVMNKMWELKGAQMSTLGMVIEPHVLAELRGMQYG